MLILKDIYGFISFWCVVCPGALIMMFGAFWLMLRREAQITRNLDAWHRGEE